MELDRITYEVQGRVAVITLDRPEKANAQDAAMLHQLDAAWAAATDDDVVRAIVLQANGKHFSAGHDMDESGSDAEPHLPDGKWTMQINYRWEERVYFGYAMRWRDCPKPSIAAVQGACIAGGLLLCWPCDLIVAADDARFSDPVVAMGIGGVEVHGHTWELGHRKAKELLFLGNHVSAHDAERLGMVNKVVPLADLRSEVMAWANRIADMDPFGLYQAKRAVHQTMDAQGYHAAVRACFDIHHVGHGHAMTECGQPVLVDLDQMKHEVRRGGGA